MHLFLWRCFIVKKKACTLFCSGPHQAIFSLHSRLSCVVIVSLSTHYSYPFLSLSAAVWWNVVIQRVVLVQLCIRSLSVYWSSALVALTCLIPTFTPPPSSSSFFFPVRWAVLAWKSGKGKLHLISVQAHGSRAPFGWQLWMPWLRGQANSSCLLRSLIHPRSGAAAAVGGSVRALDEMNINSIIAGLQDYIHTHANMRVDLSLTDALLWLEKRSLHVHSPLWHSP